MVVSHQLVNHIARLRFDYLRQGHMLAREQAVNGAGPVAMAIIHAVQGIAGVGVDAVELLEQHLHLNVGGGHDEGGVGAKAYGYVGGFYLPQLVARIGLELAEPHHVALGVVARTLNRAVGGGYRHLVQRFKYGDDGAVAPHVG